MMATWQSTKARLALASFFILLQLQIVIAQQKPQPADLILHNGFIWTVDDARPQAEAIAIRGEQIIKVGGNAEVMRLKKANTRVIDLKGAFVVPGFNDNHVHFASAAQFFWNIQLMDVHSDAAFVQRVREYVAMRPGEPIRGGGWGAYEQWERGASAAGGKREFWIPHRKLIDAITGETPMLINKFDNSLYFANTAALKRAGIGDREADSQNIAHLRDATGRLTGAMRLKNARTCRITSNCEFTTNCWTRIVSPAASISATALNIGNK
jgi:predicted amidohydrolase YtcJ